MGTEIYNIIKKYCPQIMEKEKVDKEVFINLGEYPHRLYIKIIYESLLEIDRLLRRK